MPRSTTPMSIAFALSSVRSPTPPERGSCWSRTIASRWRASIACSVSRWPNAASHSSFLSISLAPPGCAKPPRPRRQNSRRQQIQRNRRDAGLTRLKAPRALSKISDLKANFPSLANRDNFWSNREVRHGEQRPVLAICRRSGNHQGTAADQKDPEMAPQLLSTRQACLPTPLTRKLAQLVSLTVEEIAVLRDLQSATRLVGRNREIISEGR